MSLRRRLTPAAAGAFSARHVRTSAISAAIRLLYTLFEFIIAALLARALGAADFGVYAFVYSLLRLATIPAQAGIPALLTREIASYEAQNQWAELRGLLASVRKFVIVSSIIAVAGLVSLALFGYPQGDSNRVALLVISIAVPLRAMAETRSGALRGFRRVVRGQLQEGVIRPGIFLAGIGGLLLAADDPSAGAVVWLLVASYAAAYAYSEWSLYRATPGAVRAATPRFEYRRWLRSIGPLTLLNGMQILNAQVGLVALGIFRSEAEVGVYRIAVQMSQLVMFGLTVATMVVSPQLSRLFAKEDRGRLQDVMRLCSLACSVQALGTLLVYVAFGQQILIYLFGPDFTLAYWPLLVLSVAQVINSGTGVSAAALNMTHNERSTLRALVLSLAIAGSLTLALVPSFGTQGAAIASAAGITTSNLVLVLLVRRKLNVNPLPTGMRRQGH